MIRAGEQPVLVSAALIVKNESAVLERCLRSAALVADELVVVDTGSSDDSREIARRCGARVVEFPWTGDFSAARNFAMDHSSGRWMLYLDADEELHVADRGSFRGVLAADSTHVSFRPLLKARSTWTAYREFRVFLRRPDLRFRGVMHETVMPDISRIASTEGLKVGPIDALIVHHGYEGDQSAKHARNLPLLLAQIEKTQHRAYLHDHVGRIYSDLGDLDRAEAAWEAGVEWVRADPDAPAVDGLPYADLLLHRSGRGQPDLDLANEALGRFPQNPLVLWAAIDTLSALRLWERAAQFAEILLGLDRDAIADDALAIDEAILGPLAHGAHGIALFALGRYEEAAAAFGRAAELAPEDQSYRVRAMLASARAKQ